MANPAAPLKESLQVPVDCKTPPSHQSSDIDDINDSCKCKPSSGLATPNRLTVPKPFKYPERYTSPTDHIMSPISKGLLGRSRTGRPRFPPSLTHSNSKVHELGTQSPQNIGQMRLKMES